MGFWVASSDSSGNRIVGSEEQLTPGPAAVDYPQQSAGLVMDTDGGAVVKLQPKKDPRRRSWLWRELPTYTPRYTRMIHQLEGLLSTTRRARGLSPWVYIRDTETTALRVWRTDSGTITSATVNTISDSTKSWATNIAQHGIVEITSGSAAGQWRSVLSNTGTTLTIDPQLVTGGGENGGGYFGLAYLGGAYFGGMFSGDNGTLVGATYSLMYPEPVWLRARVVAVMKQVSGAGGVRNDEVRLEFLIDDPTFTTLD